MVKKHKANKKCHLKKFMECKKSAMISFMVSGFLFSPKKALPTLRLYQYSCK